MFKVGDRVKWNGGKSWYDNLFFREMNISNTNPRQTFTVEEVHENLQGTVMVRLSGPNSFIYPVNTFSLAEQHPLSYYLGGT